jgi:hypothetical protein
MKSCLKLIPGVALLSLLPAIFGAAPRTDIMPPQRREVSVDTAERLAKRKAPEPLPTEQPSPFNPAGFDKADPADTPRPAGPTPAAAQPAPAPGDRQILESLATRIPSTGTINLGGKPRLTISGGKMLEVGTKFTVTDPATSQDYELELIAIDRTTFTLRYRNEETTRPIKLVQK